jgi:hypothetical protein
MTEYDKNELAFIASRAELERKFHEIREFLETTTPEKVGKKRYENLFSISGLGLMLILENRLMYDELEKLRKQLNRSDREHIELLKKYNELLKK